ncbi:MAG: heme-binding protein, partial [Planctomycetaceae bacterium]
MHVPCPMLMARIARPPVMACMASMTCMALAVGLLADASAAPAEQDRRWEQASERMPNAAAKPRPVEAAAASDVAPWIWGADADREYRLVRSFRGPVRSAMLVATCDNRMALSINGTQVGSSGSWERPVRVDLTPHVRDGDNELVAEVGNAGGPSGFSCRLVLTAADGATTVIVSDASWTARVKASEGTTAPARIVAKAGDGPWGDVLAGRPGSAADASPAFNVPEGFAVERLFIVPKEELGSWVSLTSDPRGRLIASDQGDKGLVRITPAAADGSTPTVVERIPVDLTGAQGLLWAFDALYVVCNGGPGSGLYRVTDSDGDDTLDRVEKLRAFDGGGEHGPHNVVLSPDGTRLFIVCGNHTKVPFGVTEDTPPQTMGGIR